MYLGLVVDLIWWSDDFLLIFLMFFLMTDYLVEEWGWDW